MQLQSKIKLKGKCDICRKKDGFWGHNLLQCRICGVLVHELCYGLPETGCKNPDFTCLACDAIGVEVEVNVPSLVGGHRGLHDGGVDILDLRGEVSADGGTHHNEVVSSETPMNNTIQREWFMQESRPKVCVLCSHDKGIHAMHPLLDVHGPEGRQLTWNGRHHSKSQRRRQKSQSAVSASSSTKETTRELAWVHTLCASMICSYPNTRGCVYGCDKNGNYYCTDEKNNMEEEDEDEDDDEEEFNDSITPTTRSDIKTGERMKKELERKDERSSCIITQDNKEQEDDGNDSNDISTKYYAIATEGEYAKAISEHRRLKCFICGEKDDTWRIPLQCAAGDDNEYGPFQVRHLSGTEACTVAMHVGCARWGCTESEISHLEVIHGKRCNLCFFTPGKDDHSYAGQHADHRSDYHEDHRQSSDVPIKNIPSTRNGGAVMEVDTIETIAHCYCAAHARDILMNNPRNRRRKRELESHEKVEFGERLQVFPRDRKDRGLTRRERNAIIGITSDSRRQLINRMNKF